MQKSTKTDVPKKENEDITEKQFEECDDFVKK